MAKTLREILELLGNSARFGNYGSSEAWVEPENKKLILEKAVSNIQKLIPSKKRIAETITKSTLWNLGADSHQALSELTEAIVDDMKERLK